jgi:RNA polymerase sigma-70 factor (ECF subfamily)
VRIGAHVAVARRRRSGRLVPVGDAAALEPEETTMSTPEDDVSRSEVLQLVERAVDGLPEGLRTVLVLRQIEGLSTRETADCLALSEEAVKVRLHRARSALRADLERTAGFALRSVYGFDLVHCDRITRRVLERTVLLGSPEPG